MPIFSTTSKSRRRFFRASIVLVVWGFLCLTFFSLIGFFLPERKRAITQEEAFAAYDYYYGETSSKKIALTFDDGPTGKETIEIADTLERYGVSATFFFIGEHILRYPEVVKEISDRGFGIGNHTFTHSYAVHNSHKRLALELSATSRLIERITGETPVYYRPPYLLSIGVDPAPNPWISSIDANRWALALGYLPVGTDIDPRDWNALSSGEIITHFGEELHDQTHIVLFHDTKDTAEAIQTIIPSLLASGYEIVPLEELLTPPGQPPLSQGTPAPPPVSVLESAYIYMYALARNAFVALGTIAVGLILLRIVVLLVLLGRGKNYSPPKLTRYPFISIIIPAHNEEQNIRSTLRSVLHSSYPRREIIVLDDGSTDQTSALVEEIRKNLPRGAVRLVELPNGGKAQALTLGAEAAKGEVLVVLDADAVLSPEALHAFARHFMDPEVGAVAGKVYTTDTKGFLNSLQALEYFVGQNIEKRAFSAVGAVGVVPGPAGAWRTKAVLEAGGFPHDTLVEDQDMTLTLLRRGYKVVYEPEAIAYTETPRTLRDFLAQRFRWVYGTIQCFWKHAEAVIHQPKKPLGFILLPHTFVYAIFLPLTYPIVDSLLILSLIFGVVEVFIPILLFTVIDMLYALWGLRGEKQKWKFILLVPILRVTYRQLLYITVLRGLVRAIEGTGASWDKITKVGATQKFFEEQFLLPIHSTPGNSVLPGTRGDLRLLDKSPRDRSIILETQALKERGRNI